MATVAPGGGLEAPTAGSGSGRWVNGVSGNSLFSATGTEEYTAILRVLSKIDTLQQSCERVRLGGLEALRWAELTDDFSALSTSLRLLCDAMPTNFSTFSVVPHQVPADLHSIEMIPDLLSTMPSQKTYQVVESTVAKLHFKDTSLESKRLLSTSKDARQLRLQIQAFNSDIDRAKDVLQQAAADATPELASAASVPQKWHFPPLKPADLRKDYESLHGILTRLYRGTSLCPPPLGNRVK